MFVDGPEFVSVLAELDIERNILTKFLKKASCDRGGVCDNNKC